MTDAERDELREAVQNLLDQPVFIGDEGFTPTLTTVSAGHLAALRRALDVTKPPVARPTLDVGLVDAIAATLRREDLCDDTNDEHHTDEYVTSFLIALDTELWGRAMVGREQERLASAMSEVYTYEDRDNNEPTLPFVDDFDAFWTPFAAKVATRSRLADEHVTVNGHLYVHVAACPCPEMRAEVARLRLDRETSDD